MNILIVCGTFDRHGGKTSSIGKTISRHFMLTSGDNDYGHGCLVLAKNLNFFSTVKYYSRNLPEDSITI